MGTRSDIIVERRDGSWKRIYCHWDGYPDHNGKILFENYNSQELAEAVVEPGDMSSLKEEIGVKHPFDAPSSSKMVKVKDKYEYKDNPAYKTYEKKYGRMTTYYGRDRGEKDVAGHVFENLHAAWPGDDCGTEYTYVWTQGKWWVGDPDEGTQSLVDLKDVLDGNKTITSNIKAFGGNFVIGKHGVK